MSLKDGVVGCLGDADGGSPVLNSRGDVHEES